MIFYDGVCALCNQTVKLLLKFDKKQRLMFSPLQGETAKTFLKRHSEIQPGQQSVIFVKNLNAPGEKIYERSEAILNSLLEVGGFWKLSYFCKIIPIPIRDIIYKWIARNRYKWFGKYEQCPLPDKQQQKRFLP